MGLTQTGAASPRALLLLSLWVALVTGLVEVGWLAITLFVRTRPIWFGPNVAWMAPVTNVVIFAVPGLILAALARWRPNGAWLRIGAFVLTSLGALALLLLFHRMYVVAAVALAVGLGARASSLIAAHADGFLRFARRSTVALLAVVMLLAAGVTGHEWWRERRALAALPAPPAGAPNVLLLILDTVRARSLSLYGYHRPTTPNLERLARRGVTVDLAISAAPWTLPSHASMFTGRFPHEFSTSWSNPLDATHPTLAELLAQRGYRTGGFVANLFYCVSDLGLARGFSHYEDYDVSPAEFALSARLSRGIANNHFTRLAIGFHDVIGRKSAARVNRDFLNWLSRQEGQPFFAFLNYFDAHEPYLPPAPFDTMFGPQGARSLEKLEFWRLRTGSRRGREAMAPEEKQAELDAYDGALAYLDNQIGALVDSLEARDILRNTIVIVTSDHGEGLGEHGRYGHGNGLHLYELHTPLLIAAPGRAPEGVRIRRPVSLRDLGATVLSVVGFETPPFPGRSFMPSPAFAASADTVWSDTLLSEFREQWMQSLIVGHYQYIAKNTGSDEELFDLRTDPMGDRNLASTDSGREVLQTIRRATAARRARVAELAAQPRRK